MKELDVVDFAYQIVNMHETLIRQENELKRLRAYEQKYQELLSTSVVHSHIMMNNVLDVLINSEKYSQLNKE